jgi:hypothetical protein
MTALSFLRDLFRPAKASPPADSLRGRVECTQGCAPKGRAMALFKAVSEAKEAMRMANDQIKSCSALIVAVGNCRPRLMKDEHQHELICIEPQRWDAVVDALSKIGSA